MEIYTVSAGQTLADVGASADLSTAYLQRTNQLPNPENLVPGQTVVLSPPAIVHQTMPGETLYSIAARYSVTVMQLLRNNPFLTQRILQAGDLLIITFAEQPLRGAASLGYTYANIEPNTLRAILPYLTYLSIFTTRLSPEGTLIFPDAQNITSLSRSFGVAPLLHFSSTDENGQFDSALAHTLLTDDALQESVIAQLTAAVEEQGYAGVDVDFEFLLPEDGAAFVTFLAALHQALQKNGWILMVDLLPKWADNQTGGAAALDYAAIGEVADYVFLMTYEWGYAAGPPMAVAPLPQVKEVLSYATNLIDPQKILMGLPWYGYRWPIPYEAGMTKGVSLSLNEAIKDAALHDAGISFDLRSQTPYYTYRTDGDAFYQVWFDDAQSMWLKLRQVANEGLYGFGIWNITRPWPQGFFLINQTYVVLRTPLPSTPSLRQ